MRRTVTIDEYGDIVRMPRKSWIAWLKLVAAGDKTTVASKMPGARVLFHIDGHATDMGPNDAAFELRSYQ